MIRNNSIMFGTSAIKIISAVDQFDTSSVDTARQIYKEQVKQGVIKDGSFDDAVWQTTDEYSNLSLDFRFNELSYRNWYRNIFGMNIISFTNYVKVYVLYLFGKLVLRSIQGFLADIKRMLLTDPKDLFALNAELTLIHTNQLVEFLSFFPESDENDRINELQTALDEYDFIQEKHIYNARRLAQFESYFLFNDILDNFWKNCADEETRLFYYPVYLWWKLTTVLPTRPREFLLTARDCLVHRENGYYLTLRKNCLKGRKKVAYKISADYRNVTYKIPDDLGKCIEEYLLETDKYSSTQLNTLFIADTHYRKWKRKKNKNSRFLTYSNLCTILRYFYDEVIKRQYGIKVIYEKNDTHLEEGTIEYIHLGDARHIALINLMQQGGTPMLAMFLAGHDNAEMSFHYSTNLTTMIECQTYRQYRLVTSGNVNYQVSHSQHANTTRQVGIPLKDGGKCFSYAFQTGDMSDCLATIGPQGEIGYCPSCPYNRKNGENYWGKASIYKRRIEDSCIELKEAVNLVRKQKGNGEEIGEAMLRLKDVSISYRKYLEEKEGSEY